MPESRDKIQDELPTDHRLPITQLDHITDAQKLTHDRETTDCKSVLQTYHPPITS